MNNSINLLPTERENKSKQKQIRLLRNISLTFMFSIVVISVGLFFLILASPLPALRQDEEALNGKLQALRKTTAKLYLTKERLGTVQTILQKRPAFEKLLTRVANELPSDSSIRSVSLTRQALLVEVNSPSLLSLQSFIDRMHLLQSEEKTFKSVTISELSTDEENSGYSVQVKATL